MNTHYRFSVSMDASFGGPGCYTAFRGQARKVLIYEDYMTGEYEKFWFVNSTATAWDQTTDPAVSGLEDKKIYLLRAKDEPNFYKVYLFDKQAVIEFEYDGGSSIIVNTSSRRFLWNVTNKGDVYQFDTRIDYCSFGWNTDGVTMYLELEGWINKNGESYPNIYNTYQDFIFHE